MEISNTFTKAAVLSVALLGTAAITGCSDAHQAALGAWGEEAVVLAYSGGKLTYAGISSGKVESELSSEGYYFTDKCQNGALAEVGGDVNIIPHPMGKQLNCDNLPKVETPTYKF
tara:strand:+ start:35768 stop:36112 length:345 start_codon:yes stop_codon:yes gene_type:complete